jgi:hypothetical protein
LLLLSSSSLVATSADSVSSSYLVRITIAPIGTTFGNLQWRRYWNNFTFEYSSNNNIFSFVAMSADSVPSSKTNIFQNKLIYCRHFRTYSRCAMFDWSDTVFRRRNVTRRPYYSRGIEGEKPRFADCFRPVSGVPNIDCVSGLLSSKYENITIVNTPLQISL